MKKAIVLLSGGIDSAVALGWARQNYDQVIALSFIYYLRPFRERLAVYRLLEVLPAPLIEVGLPFLKEANDAHPDHFSHRVPEGYISNRNMIFYSIACHYAEMKGCEEVVGGHTLEDQQSFPDASESYLQRLIALASEALLTRKVQIQLPLGSLKKIDIIRKAKEWNVPLQHTWSCYWDGEVPCGKCISCRERAQAFAAAGMKDPASESS